ncbi:MAG: hypothetical protein ABIH11_02850 [Candidatus Altiarchaeota archaeon]
MADDVNKPEVVAVGKTCQPSCPFCNPWFVATFMLGLFLMMMDDRAMHYVGVAVILVAYSLPLLKYLKPGA